MRNIPVLLFALLMIGCASSTKPLTSSTADRRAQEDQLSSLFQEKGVPATARTIGPFLQITTSTTMNEVVRLCGYPDADIGSGLCVFEYKLQDGSDVLIGTGDLSRLLYVIHRTGNLIENLAR